MVKNFVISYLEFENEKTDVDLDYCKSNRLSKK